MVEVQGAGSTSDLPGLDVAHTFQPPAPHGQQPANRYTYDLGTATWVVMADDWGYTGYYDTEWGGGIPSCIGQQARASSPAPRP